MTFTPLASTPALSRDTPGPDLTAYKAAVKTLRPFDTLILADGEWRDFAGMMVVDVSPAN